MTYTGSLPYFPIDVYIKPPGGTFNINNTAVTPNVPWASYLDYSSDTNQLQIVQYWGRQGFTAQIPLTAEYLYEPNNPTYIGQLPFIIQPLSEIKLVNTLLAGGGYNPNTPSGVQSPGLLFAGVVQNPNLYRQSPNLVQWYLQCLDYSLYATTAIVNQAYTGVTIDNIVVDLVNSVTPITGVSAATVANGGFVAPGVWVPFISFQWQTLADAINTATTYASQNAQYGWWVDEFKQFHFYNQFQAPNPVVQINDSNYSQILSFSSITTYAGPPSGNEVALSGTSTTANLFPGMMVSENGHESQILKIIDATHFVVGVLPNTTVTGTMLAWLGQQHVWDAIDGNTQWSPATITTPYLGQIEVNTEFYYEWDATQLYNQIFVLGTEVTQPLNILLAPTDVYTCDGRSRSFPLSFPILSEDTSAVYEGIEAFVTLNNVPQTIGLQTAEQGSIAPTVNGQNFGAPTIQPTAGSIIQTGNQQITVTTPNLGGGGTQTVWVVNQSTSGQWYLTANTGTPTPPAGAVLQIWYSYQIPNVAVASDANSISTLYHHTFQEIITDSTLLTGTAAFARAARELTEYSRVEERLNGYTTQGMVGHFNAGDVIEANLTLVPDSLNSYQIGARSFLDSNNQFIVTNNTITVLADGYLQYQFQALRIATSG